MVGNKEEVLQAIKKLTNDNGYVFINNGGPYPPREHEELLYLAVQQREGHDRQLLNFVVTIGTSRFMITFNGAEIPRYCMNLNQMLYIIKDWLLNRNS